MAASRTYQCLSCRLKGTILDVSKAGRRPFHASPTSAARKRTSLNVKAADLGLLEAKNPEVEQLQRLKYVEKKIHAARSYTEREKQLLALKYTPEQMAIIEAGEEAVNPTDLVQGRLRRDRGSIEYTDDFATIRPTIDHPVREPDEFIDPDIRIKDDEQMMEGIQRMHERVTSFIETTQEAIDKQEPVDTGDEELDEALNAPGLSIAQRREILEDLDETDIPGYMEEMANPDNFGFSPKGRLHQQPDSLAPEIPQFRNPNVVYKAEDEDPHMRRLSLQTGLSQEAIRKLRIKVLVSHRVVNQTRLGKIASQYFLTIAGNENGMVGVGEGKAVETEDAARQARASAIRNMKPVARYEDRTIFGDVEAKVCASIVQLSARPPGFGNRCQHLIFELTRAAGIQDLAARTPRSRNKMNVVKAAWKALLSQRHPEDIARARGRKLVDVRKVYYGGQVL